MAENKDNKTSKIFSTINIIIICAAIIIATLAVVYIVRLINTEKKTEIISLEPSPVTVESVRPKGELYLYSFMAEDFVIKKRTESALIGLYNEEHSCVQTISQRISYKLDFDKIEYLQDSLSDTVYVKMQSLDFVASTQSSSFMSDNETYWKKVLPNTNGLKKEVENKIKKRYDIPQYRKKAEEKAQRSVKELLSNFGLVAVFENPHKKDKETETISTPRYKEKR